LRPPNNGFVSARRVSRYAGTDVTVSFAGTVTQSYVVLQFVSLLEGQEEGHFSIALSTLGVY
jgi:hypothetical protein